MRVIGDNSDGFANERDIRDALNSKVFDNINPNLRNFLKNVFQGYDLRGRWVHAHTISQRMKPDFYVTIDGVPNGAYISVKKGGGNSIHQESLDNFIEFLKEEGIPEYIIKNLKLYHFSDGTTDNTGEIRWNSREYNSLNPDIVKTLNSFFNDKAMIKKALKRFLFAGNYPGAPEVDYLYHGDVKNGVWASKKEIIDFCDTLKRKDSSFCFGPLTYQAWNKNLTRKPEAEKKRLQMQIKWSSLCDNLTEITSKRKEYMETGTFAGELSERASVITFNKNPYSEIFTEYLKTINRSPETTLLIRVTSRQMSKLSNKLVNTRADAYAVEVIDNRLYDILEENDYYLDEDLLIGYDEFYRKIDGSGISIKKDNSNDYTLIKLTPNSFFELFGSFELGFGASIFCKKSSELIHNIALMRGWHTTIEDLRDYFVSDDITEELLTNSLEFCQSIKRKSIDYITASIDHDPYLQEVIFNGKEIYDEPYSAAYFMQNNYVRVLNTIPYYVTTGSGRTHGNYSIVLKPKT